MAKKHRNPNQDDDGLSREEYFAERSLLIEARQRSFQRAEQMVMGGATGALLLSVTFVEKLAPAGGPVRGIGWLVGGWIALLVCMCVSMFGQYAAGWAFTSELARLDAECNGETPKPNLWRARNTWCGGISSVLLVAGIAMLALFAYLNAPFHP